MVAKQKGELLLKEMRILRYPYYQKKSEELTSNWQQIRLEQDTQAKKALFLERGILELSFSACSLEEMKQKIMNLYQSLSSPVWNRIWEQ